MSAFLEMDGVREQLEARKAEIQKAHKIARMRLGKRYEDTAMYRERERRMRVLNDRISEIEVVMFGCL
jgi:hypothetical protein